MDFDACSALKSGLGTGTVIVMDKSTDLVKADRAGCRTSTSTRAAASARRAAKAPAGCGGSWSGWSPARPRCREIDMLLDVASQVEGHTICGLGDAAAWPIQGLFRHFRHEVEDRITQYRAGKPARSGRHPCGGGVDGMPIAKVNGVEVEFEARHERAAGGGAGRGGDPALLLPRAPEHRRQLPHVPGRGEARPAEAAGLLRAAGRRGPGDLHQHADGARRPAKG